MRAINIINSGISSSLQIDQRPIPIAKADEVLIKVHAAGVNRPDIMQRQGLYPPPAGAVDILGLEVAGTIAALGSNITHLNIGDKVCALITGGGYAEYCTASAQLCLAIPDALSFVQAAALPETYFTVWSNVFDRASLQLQVGETLLVHGGSSGIGTTAIQLAKAFGAKVIVTAGSEEKCLFCTELGADLAINYQQQDFVEEIKCYTQGKGVNVILDMVGGDYLARNIKCMDFDARLVQIALQKGIKAELNLLPVMLKRLTLTGSTLRSRSIEFKAHIAKQLKRNVWPLLTNGQIKPVIYQTFPLAEAEKAHALMETSLHIGKIILTV
ncbi:NAD(P)H-quinone oxidoreductase [Methyloprofundus sedimenti]|uniref:NAD(P)H-quinone oxidoreductase n=1 Tax=Methyloprofundus sedimenti TaxID=1420851 RepID=A0A1V8M6L6_9GAMM|nr:NAD(P)H-quinone oxidoreductase [Methyloprofundus sedimenti]OQK17230.1 NAD(P)H-quinone oxidoreductase [Methyloprofundus sedimenti]